tara:strand:- start:1160 stop:1978 length:819 start_codon:yes stop_codon:yes gene_type:complete
MKKIIYDLGSGNGENIPYYLLKSDLVVAVEAIPKFCEEITIKFNKEILEKKLIVENFIITTDKGNLDKEFFIHKNKNILSQFPIPKPELRDHFIKTKLPSKNLIEIIKKHGNPYYIKIDTENYDYEILSELFINNIFPEYLSVECYDNEIFEKIIKNENYNSYKLVCGANVHTKYNNRMLSLENKKIKYSFPLHSAGPFGNDIDGKWLAKKNFKFLFSFANTTWIDIHCSKVDLPNKYYLPIDLMLYFNKKILKKFLILILIIIFIIIIKFL